MPTTAIIEVEVIEEIQPDLSALISQFSQKDTENMAPPACYVPTILENELNLS